MCAVFANQNSEICVSTCALEGNGIGQNHVECRQPVGGDDQQVLIVDIVDITHLALVNLFETVADASQKAVPNANTVPCESARDCYH